MRILLSITAAVLALAASGAAQAQGGQVFDVVLVDVAPATIPAGTPQAEADKIAAERFGQGRKGVMQLASACKVSIGCLRFDVLLRSGTQNHYVLQETWASQRDLDNFEASATSKAALALLVPILGSPLDERVHDKVN